MTPIIKRFVIKLLSKDQGSGITKLPGQMQAGFQESMVTEKLIRKGYDPRAIKSEEELKMILNRIDASATQSKEQKEKAMKQLATIMDMKGRKIKPGARIMGGEEVVETEAEILERLKRGNKETVERIKERKLTESFDPDVEDAIDNASPGFANDIKYDAQLVADDLAEKMYGKEFYDLSQKQQSDVYGKAYDGLAKQRFKNKKKPSDADDPNYDAEPADFDPDADNETFAIGGRAGFSMGRRAFLKLMGGAAAGIGALKTGALKMFGKEGAKNIPQVVTTPPVAGKPAWFDSVVNKVIAEGDDVTKQFAYKDRMQVNTKQISPTEEVTVYRDLDDGSVRINYGAKMRIDETKPYEKGNIRRASNDPDQVDLIVREGEVIEPVIEGKYKGTVGRKTQSSFEASEAEPRSVGGPEDADIEFDGERIVNNVDDLMQDVSTLEEFGTGKKLIGDKAAKAKKKKEDYQKFTEDQMEQAEYLETKYGPGPEPDDFASGGLAGMLGE